MKGIPNRGAEKRQPYLEESLEFPSLPMVPGSLLDITIRRALVDVLSHRDSMQKSSQNLTASATWEFFAVTRGVLTDGDLVELLAEANETTEPHDFGAQRRSESKARGKKLNTLRSNALELLKSRRIANSKVVTGWTYALICSAALAVFRNSSKEQRLVAREALEQWDAAIDKVVDAVHQELRAQAEEQLTTAHQRLEDGHGHARLDVFLHLSAFGLLATMTRPEFPGDTQKLIQDGIYPALDEFDDPLE